MSNIVDSSKQKKYPLSATLLLIAAYVWPMIYMGIYAMFSGQIGPTQHSLVLSNPVMLTYQLFHFAISAFGIVTTIRVVKKYYGNGDEAHLKKMDRTWFFICFGHIIYLVLTSLLYSIAYSRAASLMGIKTLNFSSYFMTWLGTTLMWDMLFYISWLEITEKWMHYIPFNKKNMVLSAKLKFVLVAMFSTVAMGLLCISPILYPVNMNKSHMELFNAIWPLAVIAIVLVTIDFILLVRSTLQNLKEFNIFTEKLADGDYTQQGLKVISRDEYGLLVNNLNVFYDNTKKLLTNLMVSVDNSNTAATESTECMQNITSSVSKIVERITDVQEQMQNQSAGVEEAASIVKEIGGSISDLNVTIEKQVAAVEESSAAVNQMVANIQSVTNILEKNQTSTNELAQASEEGLNGVKQAVELSTSMLEQSKGLIEASTVIQSIAQQTNLLAMNAAIEAAHAGESGKGFAVVADEIRKLAEQSNVQGKRITESLNTLENNIKNVSDSTRDLNKHFEEIFNLTQVVQQQETVVTNAMTEQAAGSEQILVAMHHIDDATGEVKRGSEQILEGSKQISIEMDLLAKATLSTNENMQLMTDGANTITEAVQAGNEASVKSTDSINQITEEISKFRL